MRRSLKNTLRLAGIIRTLGRHDALFPLDLIPAPPLLLFVSKVISRRKKEMAGKRPGQRLAAALQEMGPSFIKLGQILATRSDLLGDEITADLSLLQDRLPPFPGREARQTVEKELGKAIEEVFLEFKEEPVAAASIAQVHFAVTLDGEKDVAVKVLRPAIEEAFGRDIDLLYWLAGLIERRAPSLRRLKITQVVKTLEDTIHIEMDLRMEAAAADELRKNFQDDPDFHVPRVDWARTGRRVLTLERINGTRIDECDRLRDEGHDLDVLMEKSSRAFFKQAFRDGFFHADIHPGNMFVEPSGRIAVVDFGIMGRLSRETRCFLADMLMAFLNGDYRQVAEVHFQAGYVPADQSVEAFAQACRAIGEPIFGKPMHEISIARLLSQLFQVTEKFNMETQPQLLLLQKTMLVAEGVGRSLNPKVNMWEISRPLIEDWMKENRGIDARIKAAADDLKSAIERLPTVIRNAEKALEQIADGGLKLHPETIEALRGKYGGGRTQRNIFLYVALAIIGTAALAVLSLS